MPVETRKLAISTTGNTQILDLTATIDAELSQSNLQNGMLLVFVPGSTAAVTTIEFESGVVQDLKQAIETIVRRDIPYQHDARWHDGNGHSHVRAALIGPSLIIPFTGKKLLLGTWQQVVLIDFDVQPRQRQLIVQLIGE